MLIFAIFVTSPSDLIRRSSRPGPVVGGKSPPQFGPLRGHKPLFRANPPGGPLSTDTPAGICARPVASLCLYIGIDFTPVRTPDHDRHPVRPRRRPRPRASCRSRASVDVPSRATRPRPHHVFGDDARPPRRSAPLYVVGWAHGETRLPGLGWGTHGLIQPPTSHNQPSSAQDRTEEAITDELSKTTTAVVNPLPAGTQFESRRRPSALGQRTRTGTQHGHRSSPS